MMQGQNTKIIGGGKQLNMKHSNSKTGQGLYVNGQN